MKKQKQKFTMFQIPTQPEPSLILKKAMDEVIKKNRKSNKMMTKKVMKYIKRLNTKHSKDFLKKHYSEEVLYEDLRFIFRMLTFEVMYCYLVKYNIHSVIDFSVATKDTEYEFNNERAKCKLLIFDLENAAQIQRLISNYNLHIDLIQAYFIWLVISNYEKKKKTCE